LVPPVGLGRRGPPPPPPALPVEAAAHGLGESPGGTVDGPGPVLRPLLDDELARPQQVRDQQAALVDAAARAVQVRQEDLNAGHPGPEPVEGEPEPALDADPDVGVLADVVSVKLQTHGSLL
jgi:hypothetical protein